MKNKVKFLEEGWVKFIRIPCKEGHIDRWMGDSIDDPNKDSKSNIQLNSTATWYRCNSGKWKNSYYIGTTNKILSLLEYASEFSAEEIWEELNK